MEFAVHNYFILFSAQNMTSVAILAITLAVNFFLVKCVHAPNDFPNCYIKHFSGSQKDLCWSSDAKHSNQRKTCTVLHLEPEVYKIRSKHKISDRDEFAVVGNGATIICHNSKLLLVFSNINMLQVSNITLVNCNITFAQCNISELPSVFLYNVTSVQLSNVASSNNNEHVLHAVNSNWNISIVNTDGDIYGGNDTNYDSITDSMCYCEGSHIDCSTNVKIDQSIYPGQNLVLRLKSLSDHKTGVCVASQGYRSNAVKCEVASSSPSHQKNFLHNNCTDIAYTIMSNSTDWCLLYLKTLNTHTLHTYNITLKRCPVGLVNHGGHCVCNPQLEANGITCNISTGTFNTPPNSWISKVGNTSDMMYSTECYMDYCSRAYTTVNLSEPQQQCLTNRDGIICGKCCAGYSAVFGT